MIKIIAFFILQLLIFNCFADNKPADTTKNIRPFGESHFFLLRPDFQLLAELKAAKWEEDQSLYSLKLGGRKSLSNHLKLGLFFQRAYGTRHDNDWIKDSLWHWRDRSHDGQDSIIVDTTYKNLITPEMTYEVRASLEHNSAVGRTFFRPRLGTSYFLKNSHITLMHELTIPLENRVRLIQEHWSYLSYSYHFNRGISFGPLVAERQVHWESSNEFTSRTHGSYLFTQKSWYAGLNYTQHFE